MSKTKESKLEEKVERLMQRKGIWQLARYQAQSNQNGLPDRLYLYKGYLLGLELKTEEGKPTELQLKKLEEINNNGGIGLIIRNVETIKKLIEYIDVCEQHTLTFSSSIRMMVEEWMKENGY